MFINMYTQTSPRQSKHHTYLENFPKITIIFANVDISFIPPILYHPCFYFCTCCHVVKYFVKCVQTLIRVVIVFSSTKYLRC